MRIHVSDRRPSRLIGAARAVLNPRAALLASVLTPTTGAVLVGVRRGACGAASQQSLRCPPAVAVQHTLSRPLSMASASFSDKLPAEAPGPPDEPDDGIELLISRAVGSHVTSHDCQPSVRLRTQQQLAESAEKHAHVLSLLPDEVRIALLAPGAIGKHLHATQPAVPPLVVEKPELASSAILLTSGKEALLAPHLCDAVAWHLGASSVVCHTSSLDAPGSFKHDLTPCM
jgi:hypothetical protein